MKSRDHLVNWLRDAHAMEQQAISIMRNQIGSLSNYPEFEQQLRRHLQETEHQRDRIERCLVSLDESASSLKDAATKFMGNMSAWMTAAAPDEVLKSALADYSFENFEIASYRVLIAASDECGESTIGQTCRDILKEEQAMAAWIEESLPSLTKAFLLRDQDSSATAK